MLSEESILIKQYLENIRSKVILNVCSSDEKYFKILQPHIWENIHKPVLDNNNQLLNLDMKEGEGIDIINNCQNMVDVQDNSIDTVLFFSGIEHVENPKLVLSEIYRVLKHDGLLIASAPGVYPKHNDPIDTMLRLPNKNDWKELLGENWIITSFDKTEPIPAKKGYNFSELVFATIITARKKK